MMVHRGRISILKEKFGKTCIFKYKLGLFVHFWLNMYYSFQVRNLKRVERNN